MIKKLDDLTKYIQKRLSETGLDKRVNVIYLSDHGMNTVTPSNFIDLTNFVGNDTCKFYGTSPTLQVVPNDKGKNAKRMAYISGPAITVAFMIYDCRKHIEDI